MIATPEKTAVPGGATVAATLSPSLRPGPLQHPKGWSYAADSAAAPPKIELSTT